MATEVPTIASATSQAGAIRSSRSAPPAGRPRRSASRTSRRRRDAAQAILFISPAAVLYVTFLLIPWGQSLWISFFDWDGIGAASWVGLDNYGQVLFDPDLRAALVNALKFIVFYTAIPLLLGLVIAAVISSRKRRGASVVQTVIFLPQILPLVAVGVIWRFLYSDDGPINQVFTSVGLGHVTRAWLGDFDFAFFAVGLVGTWVTTGLCTLLLLAGMQKIDPSIYEASKLDGANALGTFWHITVPSLRREIVVAATLTIIAALASFDVVYVTTGGGPGTTTTVPGVLMYQLVFSANRVGTACALATIMSLLMIAIVFTLNRIGRER